ncbi:peptide chain release factor N(5)-glutamine methyltransferase [Flavobacterium jejuense]|uniref:Release factor glutamine methyltransferase n=1 Tax=Flavobacterium jejuense TaxID=1544455 RepID=A0ABX0IMS0_9FLAO|nr:peptide chain release factor N(5)-glutamine methyltransferase [Flavobacterium jejuense]NHN25097.1 peptide chain release factor N(5)-glutamine methyltransferase [Flavobacterium jejuense]
MFLKEYKAYFTSQLESIVDAMEIESFFFIILEYLHQMKRVDLALNPNFELNEVDLAKWNSILKELKQEKPIQYSIGETEFYGLRFFVNKNTLIPRPETEELVEWIIESQKEVKSQKSELKILDIGTGSGCIPIALKINIPNAEVSAIDVSEDALVVAKKNAIENKAEINFIKVNILEVTNLETQFDVIVSNPPYVRNLEKHEINKNVLEYEPHLALFVEDNDALLFYRKIAELAKINLSENGMLFFEINQYLGNETTQLLESLAFKNIKLKKDFYGNDRMICCNL